MAAILGTREVGVRQLGGIVAVPQDYTARLMYYLNSVCNAMDLSENEDTEKLRNYAEFYDLSEEEVDVLVELCFELSPSQLIGKVFIQDDELCGDSNNKFFELSSVRSKILLTENVLIAGQARAVRRVMFFKTDWAVENWIEPMRHFSDRLVLLKSGLPRETFECDDDDSEMDVDGGAEKKSQNSCCVIS